MAFISVMSIVYGVINIQKTKTASEQINANCIRLSQEAITKCKEAAERFDDNEDYLKAIDYYVENIENADTPGLKVSVARSALRYAIAYFTARNIGAEGSVNGVTLPFESLIQEFSDLKIQLDNAI